MQQFSIFRALGLACRTWGRNFLPILIIAGALYAPAFLYIGFADASADPAGVLLLHPALIATAAALLIAPLLTYRVVQDLNGSTASIGATLRYGLRGIPTALIVWFVASACNLIPVGWVLGAMLLCRWFVATPAAVAEQLGPIRAIRRGAELTRSRRLGIFFGLILPIGLIELAVMFGVIVPMIRDHHGDLDQVRLAAHLMIGTTAVFRTFSGVVEAVAYALLRQDKEGISHQELASVFG